MDQLKRYLKPPHFDDEIEQRIANLEYLLLLVLFCATTLVTILTIILRYQRSFYIAFSTFLIILVCVWLIRSRQLVLVSYIIPSTLILATTIVLIVEQQRVHDYTILLYPLAVILSGLLIGRKAPITFTILILFCLGIMYVAEVNHWIPEAFFNPTYLTDIALISIYMLMTGFLVFVAIKLINENLFQLQALNVRLQQSEANYRLLFEEAPDAILITDENGYITMVNSGAVSMLGYPRQEIIGKRPQDFIAPEDQKKRRPTNLSLLKKGLTFRHERILVRKDGTRLQTYTSSKALSDDRFQFLATDITERIEAEQALHHLNIELEQRVQKRTAELEASNFQLSVELSERERIEESLRVTLERTQVLYQIAHALIAQDDLSKLLTAIVNHMVKALSADDGLLITFDIERKKVLQFVREQTGSEDINNISYEELWNGLSGWVMRELKPALSLKGETDLRESEKARQIRQADQRGSIIVVPLHYRQKIIGTLTALNRLDQPDFMDTDVEMMTAIANQASIAIENTRLFEQLQLHANELENTNQELESFAYSVSHDLRAPLRAISGFSKIIFEDFGDHLPEDGQDLLTRVIRSSQQMNELIESLLTFSRLTRLAITPVEVDLSAMALNITSELQLNDPSRSVTVTIEPHIQAYADYYLIHNVLSNLLENAWKYSAKNERAQIWFESQTTEDEAILLIRDNGVGFDMQYADRLFTPFQRLHNINEFPGHGIGLASAQRIIHRHGGRIWADSQPGEGATFYFTLRSKS